MSEREALKRLDRSQALRPCSTCKGWSWRTDARCPDCKTSPQARIKAA
jgi:DnaJ-class molecular chaperone